MFRWLLLSISCIIFLVTAASCQKEYDVRLLGGDQAVRYVRDGLVQVYSNKTWNILCALTFGTEEADVVCRQLGYSGVSEIVTGVTSIGRFDIPAPAEGGLYSAFLYNVTCTGSEASLSECSPGNTTDEQCFVDMAGLYCEGPMTVRLVGGGSANEGALQVRQNGDWLAVCSDDWGLSTAHMACRNVGFEYALGVPAPGTWDLSASGAAGGITVSDGCTDYDLTLSDCLRASSDPGSCGANSTNLALVNCTSEPVQKVGTEVRFVEGDFEGEGYVEVLYLGEWVRVDCAFEFPRDTAQVLCRQLGYPHLIISTAYYRTGLKRPLFNGIECQGNETSIADCRYFMDIRDDYCRIDYNAYLICSKEAVPFGSEVRLVQGTTEYEGRVEIPLTANRSGTVCSSDTWDLNAANVVCRQLGYEPAVAAPTRAYFGISPQRSYMTQVRCNGTEANLSECESRGPAKFTCDRETTASVICGNEYRAPKDGEIRLVAGETPHEGRLEIGYQGEWAGICRENFDDHDAYVVCHTMLGYYNGISWNTDYGSSETAAMKDVGCSRWESHILDCPHKTGTTTCGDDIRMAGVYCDGYQHIPAEWNLRLAGGTEEENGRPEIFHNGSWQYLCYTSVTSRSVDVMCRQMGHTSGNYALSSRGPETVHPASPLVFSCSGEDSETSVEKCPYIVNKTIPVEGCGAEGVANINCDVYVEPATLPPPKPQPSIIIKAICTSVAIFVAVVMIIFLLVRRCCCSGSSSAGGAGDTSMVTASYGPVSQTEQGQPGEANNGGAPPPDSPPPPYEETKTPKAATTTSV